MDRMIARLDAWVTAAGFAGAMLAAWGIGWRRGRRAPFEAAGQDPGTKFTDASLALLGLLLAFTFSMALVRHDQRRQAAVAEANAIGDLYTCVTVLPEPSRAPLQAVVRDYARLRLAMARMSWASPDWERALPRCQELQARMTTLVAGVLAGGTAIATPLTNTLNEVTSAQAAHLAAYEENLPWIIVLLLFLGSIAPAYLMGVQQGLARLAHLSGTFSFVGLVTLVIFVTLDLNQPAWGLIQVSHQSLERLVQAMGP